jgi:DNA gyrase/topoisomerase IV subunit A
VLACGNRAVQAAPVDTEARRQERLAPLAAMDAALADPVRLVTLLVDAEDDEDALRRVRDAFDLTDEQAASVLDLQFRRLHRAGRARVAAELAVLRAEWGPALPATLAFTDRRSAVLTVEREERRFTARGLQAVLGLVTDHLLDDVAVPRLRPVVVTVTGPADAPVRFTVVPSRSASYQYAGDVET